MMIAYAPQGAVPPRPCHGKRNGKRVGIIAHRSAIENGGRPQRFIPCGMLHFRRGVLKVMSPGDNIVSPFILQGRMNRFNAFIRNKIICALSQRCT
jgi:predicted Rossmann fold nucleotide-binding protein DprA/Smf involved in DNA uptake